ncbi:MAG: UDP-N-acetylmuramate dehydrogenase [Clostridia bacterium]|nr:UDP-N-acetylmuramate dehydrogenase [Clostridia bacterium]
MKRLISSLDELKISYRLNEPMKSYTTFKTGGPAEVFIIPRNEDEIKTILSVCSSLGTDTFILGKGSNLLVSDEGIRDKAVIYIGESFDYIRKLDDCTFEAGAGASVASVCKFALSESLTGLEFAYGIPGSVGGAAFMNAGAYGGEVKDVIKLCRHIDSKGVSGQFSQDELDFSYRHSAYSAGDYVITSVVFSLKKGDKKQIEAAMSDFIGRRKDKQPLEYPSAGSVFKRPVGYFAGALIEQSGLKGKRIGGAMVSEKHAGFIINYDNATTADVLNLIKHCQETVRNKFAVELETEIKFV